MTYYLAIIISFVLSLVATPAIKFLAEKRGIVDQPKEPRKIHTRPTALLGGVAIIFSNLATLVIFRLFNLANFSIISDQMIIALVVAALLIGIGGYLDDKYNLKPYQQIIWPLAAVIIIVASGINVHYITNPFGGTAQAIIYLAPLGGLFLAAGWILIMMYATKFLDGLDGLVSGLATIAAIVIFILGLDWDVANSATGIIALALAGSSLGFLVFNWHPAKIFLGEAGSIWIGFILGVLSIISGSKIATTALVMGIPLLDLFWVIIKRLINHQSPFSHADNKHLHFQLLKLGLSQREVVLILYCVAMIFGLIAILTSSFGKLTGLIGLVVLMIILIAITTISKNKKYANN